MSNSNLSEAFLDSIDFKQSTSKKFGTKIRPVYREINENDEEAKRKRLLSKKRRPIRGQMGTFLPPETVEERRARLEKQKKIETKLSHQSKGSQQFDQDELLEGDMNSSRASNFERELKPIREDMYEIPSHSVMKVSSK